MNLTRSKRALAEFLLAWIWMLGWMGYAQSIATTQVTDTVYRADGTAAAGTVLIAWPAFSTAAGASVPAGSTSVTIGTGGALHVALVPNAGSTPMGSYYTVVYHLDDGSVTREYWVVPVSASGVAVSAIRSTVLPATMAMQTVSKAYVDMSIAAALAGQAPDSSDASSSSASALPQAASLLGEYLLTDGAGSVAHDSSGQGNDATLGSGSQAPAWTSTGLSFAVGQTVALPAALDAARTMLFGVYVNPLAAAATHVAGGFALLLTNTVGNADMQLLLENPYIGAANNEFVDSSFGLDIFAGGSTTASAFNFSGFHTIAVTLGTCGASLDRLFVDGQELAYTVQGCSAGKQTAGNFLLGSNPPVWGASAGFQGQLYLAAFYSTVLSPEQVASASGIVRNAVAARGAAVTPIPAPLTAAALNVAGDSITFGYPNLTPYSALLSLDNPPTTGVNNWGISGITLEAIAGSEDNRVGPLCKSASGPAVYSIFAGTNDFLNLPTATPATVFASLTADIQKMKTAGCRVGVVTMISRAGNTNNQAGATFDQEKQAYNALILEGARAAGADFLVDAAANPNLGADGANANTAYFQADGTHPTQLGQQAIANAYSNSYNYTFGHNRANPNVISAAAYQMLSSDGAVSLTANSAQSVTLPDCTGPSGAVYTLNNSTSAAKTVMGGAGQPINGLATAIPIPPNSSLSLFDVPNPETISGCHWEY